MALALGELLGELALHVRRSDLRSVRPALYLGAQARKLAVLLGGDSLRLPSGRGELRLKLLPLASGAVLSLLTRPGDGGLNGACALALGKLLARGELALELGVAHLPHDLRVLRLVYLEHLAAVRAPDLSHGTSVSRLHKLTRPTGQQLARRTPGPNRACQKGKRPR